MSHTESSLKKLSATEVRNIAGGMGYPIRTASGKLMGTKEKLVEVILKLQAKGIHSVASPLRPAAAKRTKEEKIIELWDSLSSEMKRKLCKREKSPAKKPKTPAKKTKTPAKKKVHKNLEKSSIGAATSKASLEAYIKSQGLKIPKKGSGKDGRVVKKDLLKVIKKNNK